MKVRSSRNGVSGWLSPLVVVLMIVVTVFVCVYFNDSSSMQIDSLVRDLSNPYVNSTATSADSEAVHPGTPVDFAELMEAGSVRIP